MTVILLLVVLACASAAPYYNHQQSQQSYYQHNHNQQGYYQDYNNQLVNNHDRNHQQYYHHQYSHQPHFPVFGYDDWNPGYSMDSDVQLKRPWKEPKKEITGRPGTIPYDGKIENNMYKIVIFLPGFKKNEITVKVEMGLLVIQADHKCEWESMKSYVDFRILPEFVDVNGRGVWTYEHCLLTIVLPLVGKSEEKPVTTEDKPVTTEDKPVTTEDIPVTTEDKPVTTEDKPVTTEISVTSNQPEYNTEIPTTETDQKVTDVEDPDDEIVRGDQGEENIVTPRQVPQGTQAVDTTIHAIHRPTEY